MGFSPYYSVFNNPSTKSPLLLFCQCLFLKRAFLTLIGTGDGGDGRGRGASQWRREVVLGEKKRVGFRGGGKGE